MQKVGRKMAAANGGVDLNKNGCSKYMGVPRGDPVARIEPHNSLYIGLREAGKSRGEHAGCNVR